MFVAIDIKDQEHEHSCFSDNTINDLKMNILGIKNVYLGIYTRSDGSTVSGRSFHEIAESADKVKAAAVMEAFANAEAKINAIPAPFDQTIVNNIAPIESAIEAIKALGDRLEEVGKVIGAEF